MTSSLRRGAGNAERLCPPGTGVGEPGVVRAAPGRGRLSRVPALAPGNTEVFGEGPRGARVVFIGEQPGDQEDRVGRPFVGPAGRLLDRALVAAGVDRTTAYVTNAVKHFKWEPRGPRRLHKKPSAREVAACQPWLLAEVESLSPELLVCLGATAAPAVFHHAVRVLQEHGTIVPTALGPPALITVHPSALLRLRDRDEAARAFAQFVDDLRVISTVVGEARPS